jgi:hypothetical protein
MVQLLLGVRLPAISFQLSANRVRMRSDADTMSLWLLGSLGAIIGESG